MFELKRFSDTSGYVGCWVKKVITDGKTLDFKTPIHYLTKFINE